jgi:hypothetical protein
MVSRYRLFAERYGPGWDVTPDVDDPPPPVVVHASRV